MTVSAAAGVVRFQNIADAVLPDELFGVHAGGYKSGADRPPGKRSFREKVAVGTRAFPSTGEETDNEQRDETDRDRCIIQCGSHPARFRF